MDFAICWGGFFAQIKGPHYLYIL